MMAASTTASAPWLVYHQQDDVAAVELLDVKGLSVGSTAYEPDGAEPRTEPTHPTLSLAALGGLGNGLPLGAAHERTAGWAIGAPVSGGDDGIPVLPLAFAVAGPGGESSWTLGLGVSLRRLCAQLADSTGGLGALQILLLDERDRVLCPRPGRPALEPAEASLVDAAHREGKSVTFVQGDGTRMQGVSAHLSSLGWRVVALQPADVALAPGHRIRAQALFGLALSLTLALGAGLLLSRRITRPIEQLVTGAAAIGDGNFTVRLEESDDEIGRLSRSFNQMSAAIARHDAEIRAWNDELKQRVDEQTRELREANDQLLRTERLAAVNTLGAGFAHEINNPLTSVLGFTQVMLARRRKANVSDDVEALVQIEGEAVRIMNIVERLRSLSQEMAGEEFEPLLIPSLLDDALAAVMTPLRAAHIRVVAQIEDRLPRVPGKSVDLKRALREIYKNSIAAMAGGGNLTIVARALDRRAVIVTITDTGIGIAPEHIDKVFDPFFTTKVDGRSEGLGLSVTHQIITRHHGRIRIEPAPGGGTAVHITLPVASEGHLV